MAKKSNNGNVQTSIATGKMFVTPLEEVLPQSMLPYAEFVILDRALPRVEDGLKPVQRRILYTMMEMGLTPDKPHKKSARIVGDCMGKYHPHGDSSVYDAMVRMAQDFNMRMTLINGHGNFGSVDGDPAAAMRYTEARLEPLALELLRDLDKETVPFSFNFDDSLLEPDLLPGRFPNLLVNGANGIAVGLATNIPTHNLGEVIDGCCAFIDNPRISLSEMMKIIPGPDFSTGGFIIANELKQAYETGRGKITLRARYNVESGEYGKRLIVITELPYQTNKADLLRKIMLLREEKKDVLSGIADIVDESDRTGTRAVIYCKKDANVDEIIKYLLKYTDLECTFGINMVAIAGGRPRQLGLLDILRYYTQYQRQVILRRTRFELKQALARCHILEGLIIGVHNVDEVVKIIKTAESTPDARRKLMERFALSERQAQAILDLRLARLAKLEVKKLEDELEALKKRIEELRAIIADKDKQWAIVKAEMRDIKRRYKSERKTRIVGAADKIAVKNAGGGKTVSDWSACITASHSVKFVDQGEFAFAAKKKTAGNASLSHMHLQVVNCKADDTIYAFTNLGNCVKLSAKYAELSEFKSSGQKLETLVEGVTKGEYPVKLYVAEKDSVPEGELLFFTKLGAVKRTTWAETVYTKNVYPAIKLKDGDELINVEKFDGDEYSTMLFVTRKGMCLNASKDDVPVQGRIAGGVKGISLGSDDYVLFATQHTGEGEIVIATTLGGFKRVVSSTIDPIGRACKGVIIADIKGKGEILFANYVTVPYALAIVNEDRTVVEVNTEEISIETRVFRGKPLKKDGVGNVSAVYALKHKSDYPDGRMQIKM
ncbi:MAG: DNA topoisomerase 4 subunit A [Clostridia bacterium]|nr:DNA topoisomerase 4 subunit A [Clostridia bacterium]